MTPTATRTSEPCTGREGGWTDNVIRYDGMASRAELVDSGGTTRYTWDGIRVLKTEDDVGTLKQRQVHGQSPSGIDSVGDITVIESSAGDAYVPEADQVGTITKVLDSSAAVANSYTYDAFGVARSASEAFSNPYRFAGKPLDADPDFYHFIARQYRPELGRFGSRDPGVPGPHDGYAYARQAPLRYVDDSGRYVGDADTQAGIRCVIWCGLIACRGAERLGDDAISEALERYPESPKDGPHDAFRHCYWSYSMQQDSWIGGGLVHVLRCGVNCAEKIGDIWEEEHRNARAEQTKMDQYNNSIGRRIGKSGRNCAEGCKEALEDGELITLS